MGKEPKKEWIYLSTESLCCTLETNTTLQISYAPNKWTNSLENSFMVQPLKLRVAIAEGMGSIFGQESEIPHPSRHSEK